ncbi:MAG: NfeD family protein [Gemmatimonadota bacterium]
MMAGLGGDLLTWGYALGLLILGFILVLLEIFVIPGLNILGVLGFGTICVGVYFAYSRVGPEAAVLIGVLALAGTAALAWLLVRNRAWHRMVLEAETDRASGFSSAPASLGELVSQTGVALSPLRPAGRAQFGERVVDVVSEGGFVTPGTQVVVLAVHGGRVVVEAVEDTA